MLIMHTVPQSCRSCRNSFSHVRHPSALASAERHAAPGSLEGESPLGDLASSSELLKGTRMDLWPYRGAAPSPVSAQNQRQSLWHVHLEEDFCLCLTSVSTIRYIICLSTRPRDATHTSGGLVLGRWGQGLLPRAPSMHPLCCTSCTQLHPSHASLVPTHGTGTTQLPCPTSIPASWGCSPATAALGCFISTPRSSSLFPPSHQSEADCSSPVLSLQYWGCNGGDLQVLALMAFITPSPFLRKGISHEPQWKSRRSTRGVEFRVWTSCSPLMDLAQNFDNGTKT